jgi:hypothetical protein
MLSSALSRSAGVMTDADVSLLLQPLYIICGIEVGVHRSIGVPGRSSCWSVLRGRLRLCRTDCWWLAPVP